MGADIYLRILDKDRPKVYDFDILGFCKMNSNANLPKENENRFNLMTLSEISVCDSGLKDNNK